MELKEYGPIAYLENMFHIGMDRPTNIILQDAQRGIRLNIGAGSKVIDGTISLDFPAFDFDAMNIPYGDSEVTQIHAYHFLEHLKDPVRMLQEFQRVLMVGGHVNIVVPHYAAQIACEDLDHKKFFTIDTWKTLFNNQYYNKNRVEWNFRIHFNMIMGIAERNLCIFTQLVKI